MDDIIKYRRMNDRTYDNGEKFKFWIPFVEVKD